MRGIWRDLVKFGEMWEFAPGWPVPHLVLDYVAAILDFVDFFVILVKNIRKCIFGDFSQIFNRFSIDVR